jgi:uncharacterized small protein (DUF1192 family)
VFKGRQLAEIEIPKKVIVPRPEKEPLPDPERDVMVAAAVQLEQHRRQRDDLRQQIIALKDEMKEKLMGAQLLIEAREMKIQECELALESERRRVAIYQDERDRAVAERCKVEADLEATEQLYGNLYGMLERFRLPAEIKRKANGTATGNGRHRVDGAVADDGAGDGAATVSA